jgi:hypothetical protein
MLYVPLGYWLHWHQCSMVLSLMVTLVVVVAAMPLNVSFVNAYRYYVLFDATVTDGSFTASIGF